MYDIVRESSSGDTIIYDCFRDLKESRLFSDLSSHITEFIVNNPKNSQKPGNIIQRIKFDYLIKTLSLNISYTFLIPNQNRIVILLQYAVYQQINYPPPKLYFYTANNANQ